MLAKKLLGGEEWREMRRLKVIMVTVIYVTEILTSDWFQDVQVKAGINLAEMEEKLDTLLHPEDYTVEEVLSSYWSKMSKLASEPLSGQFCLLFSHWSIMSVITDY